MSKKNLNEEAYNFYKNDNNFEIVQKYFKCLFKIQKKGVIKQPRLIDAHIIQ